MVTPELIQFTKLSDTNASKKKKFPVQLTKQASLTALTRLKTEGSKPTSLQGGNGGISQGRGGRERERKKWAMQLPPLTETRPAALLLLELVPNFYYHSCVFRASK